MAYTLIDFKNEVRFRLGELADGTWANDAEYQNGLARQNIDELKMCINSAQVSVCRDIFTAQWMPFRRLKAVIPILSGVNEYTLPKDYIQMVSIYHHKPDQTPIRLTPKILANYRQHDPELIDNFASEGYYFEHYEVSGQTGEILADGVVTWVDDAFQFAADNADLQNVRVGDIVNNITDGSQGIITNFGSGIATLGERLHGGRSNRMQYGDEFTIQSREENRFVLETYPKIRLSSNKLQTDEVNVDSGRITFRPQRDGTIEEINVRLGQDLFLAGGLLENINPQTRLLLYLRRVIGIDEYETLDIISWQNAKIGVNTLNVVESEINKGQGAIQLNRNTTYDAYIVQGDTQTTLPINWTLNDLDFLQPPTDYLAITYHKRPAEMILDQSVCELMEELYELVIEKAALTALRKKDVNLVNASVSAHYKALVKDAKEFMTNLQPPDSQTIDAEDLGTATYTPGYTEYYW